MDVPDTSEAALVAAPVRRVAARACAAAVGATLLLSVAGVYGAVYLALDDASPSPLLVLQRMPHVVCVLLRACSA